MTARPIHPVEAWKLAKAQVPAGPCAYCGAPDAPSVDHVTARSRGGGHDPENLVRACLECNGSKHKRSIRAWLRVDTMFARVARVHLRQLPGQQALFPALALMPWSYLTPRQAERLAPIVTRAENGAGQ